MDSNHDAVFLFFISASANQHIDYSEASNCNSLWNWLAYAS